MIVNIIDERINSYDVNVDVVFEDAHSDNVIVNATHHIQDCNGSVYDVLFNVSVVYAIEYGNNLNGSYRMTLKTKE